MTTLIVAFAVFTTGYVLCEIHDRRKARRFHARCQARLAELVADDRRPV